jgi:hypothetical protein
MTVKELQKKARTLSIKPDGLKKAQLIRVIQRAEGHLECFGIAIESCDQTNCLFRKDCLQ